MVLPSLARMQPCVRCTTPPLASAWPVSSSALATCGPTALTVRRCRGDGGRRSEHVYSMPQPVAAPCNRIGGVLYVISCSRIASSFLAEPYQLDATNGGKLHQAPIVSILCVLSYSGRRVHGNRHRARHRPEWCGTEEACVAGGNERGCARHGADRVVSPERIGSGSNYRRNPGQLRPVPGRERPHSSARHRGGA